MDGKILNITRVFLIALFAATVACGCASPEERAAYGVVKRVFGSVPANLSFRCEGSDTSNPWYSQEVKGGMLTVEGSSAVALCKGFHDYIQDNGYGSHTWSGARLELPGRLPDMEKKRVESPFERHLFYNVCTFGYSTPYWGWKEWRKELDWLALHGFDMPLAPVGTEGILYRVYSKMGLSDEEIQAYFSGPGHFPWMRMGNMCAQDGGMSRRWHERQIKLQHRILRRMSILGMEPVFQGFAGFVPEAVEKHFPEVRITRNDWHGLHNQLLGAKDSLFQVLGTAFIKEWEKEFGKGKYYLVDSFNEMDVPFGERGTRERYETIKSYSEATYKSIADANLDAVWVMQGWMFGRDRTLIWDPESVKALLDGAPDDKLLIVDLAVDFNEFVWHSEKDWDYLDGFSGKEWIWSTTPNFGGRTTLKGDYGFYLNSHLDALASPNRGNLTGFGCAPEGIESNEALYEAISSAGWSATPKDPVVFLGEYLAARYKCSRETLQPFTDGLLGSVYNNFVAGDIHDWALRPLCFSTNIFGINEGYYSAISYLLSLKKDLCWNELYRTDAVAFAADFLFNKADAMYKDAVLSFVSGDTDTGHALAGRLCEMLLAADRLLESHPLMRMQRWLDMADKSATNAAERQEFRTEALRLVTTWDAEDVHDYASRCWSGLIRDYYVPRLRGMFTALESDKGYDIYAFENSFISQTSRKGFSRVAPYDDPLGAAASLVGEYGSYSPRKEFEDVVSCWAPAFPAPNNGKAIASLSNRQARNLTGFSFEPVRGGPVEVQGVKVGNRRISYPDGPAKSIPADGAVYRYSIPPGSNVEKSTGFVFFLSGSESGAGLIRIK